MGINPPRRLDIAQLPTRVRPLDRISERWGGPRIWIKHDDDTGGLVTGNKIRKLQYAVADAQDHGADTLITCGGIQSNHCRATAAIARRVGMDVVLCLRGEAPEHLEGNLLLDHVLGAQIRWWTPEQYRGHDAGMAAVAEELRAVGKHPYVIAEGCSMTAGVWGYIEAAEEIAAAQREHEVTFDAIVHAVGSGGTSAGLLLGAHLHGLTAKIQGVCACDDAAYFRPLITALCRETIERYDLPVRLDLSTMEIVEGYVGLGYGISRPEELAVLLDLARTEGVVLDPVYSGKAMYGLRSEIEAGHHKRDGNVLFVHTGGIFGLAPHARGLAQL